LAGGFRSPQVRWPCFVSLPPSCFNLDLTDKAERTLFVKDLAIAGALMVIAAGASQLRGVISIG